AGFGDVPADSPHAPAIVDLQERGVVQGKADGSFGPRDLLTRAQLASMLARAEGLAPVASGPFSDVSGPHAGAINALAARDIIRGKGDGTFDPQGTITRDQVASMLAR
ncbi:S-layer homology domain-containing protein, partial [Nitriliruptoraceae bacterium ZYF776]|nr:S-layer homology domain-containing protein [Profundirhabdus halotolerans]